MTQHYVVGSLTLKQFLFLIAAIFAVITTLLSIWFTAAATATGSQPSLAISLVEGSNTGILGANQQRWFRMVAAAPSSSTIPVEKRFILTSTAPTTGNDLPLSLQIFESKATPSPHDNNLAGLILLGLGQPSSGGAKAIAQLLWQGQLSPGKTYYLHLVNRSNLSLEYQLQMQQVAVRPPVAQVATVVPTPTPTPIVADRPDRAAPLLPSLNQGKLGPSSRHWYTFTANSSEPARFQTFKFSLFFTPDNGQRRHNVNFELFTADEVARWQQGEANQLTNFGAGMLLSRDGDPNTGERLWRGTVIKGETYFLVIENGTEIEIDYWLFDQDIEHPELGNEN